MVAWIESTGRRRFIVAIFQTLEMAKAERLGQGHSAEGFEVHEDKSVPLPCFLTEDDNGLVFRTRQNVRQYLDERTRVRKADDWCYTNLYRIDTEFDPAPEWADQMGLLPHWHIENFHVDKIQASGLDSL